MIICWILYQIVVMLMKKKNKIFKGISETLGIKSPESFFMSNRGFFLYFRDSKRRYKQSTCSEFVLPLSWQKNTKGSLIKEKRNLIKMA
ncbi:hypothetical protein C4N15_01035 [Fusobacterium necrophorum subsp. funduliforme]|nr:hypothetical protein C4N15_01035 [Fusobacterium necrophorum subsp. funduliforme]